MQVENIGIIFGNGEAPQNKLIWNGTQSR